MLNVYRVGVPTEKFQYFESGDMKFFDSLWLKIHGEEIKESWNAPLTYIANPKKKEGHFVGYCGGRVFAVAEETIDEYSDLGSFFEQSGELLPFAHDGRRFYVFNCTNCLPAFDVRGSEKVGALYTRHVFRPERLQFTLFCVPELNELFCVEGGSAPHDEFKGYVEEQKLKGLMFEPVWSGEAP